MTLNDLAVLLEISGKNALRTVERYITHERIPQRTTMRKIREVTGGAVTADDFPDHNLAAQRAAAAAATA